MLVRSGRFPSSCVLAVSCRSDSTTPGVAPNPVVSGGEYNGVRSTRTARPYDQDPGAEPTVSRLHGVIMNPPQSPDAITVESASAFEDVLRDLTGLDARLYEPSANALRSIFAVLGAAPEQPRTSVERAFYGRLNTKLTLNAKTLKHIYATAARHGTTFNYHAKKAISGAIDGNDRAGYLRALETYCASSDVRERLAPLFGCIDGRDTRSALIGEAHKPSKLRKAHHREVEADVFNAAAGCLVWALWGNERLQAHFDGQGAPTVEAAFLETLKTRFPELFRRDRSLVIRRVDSVTGSYSEARDSLTAWMADEFKQLDNYGYLAVLLDVSRLGASSWELAGDLTLFAERFLAYPLDRLFFRWESVRDETLHASTGLDEDAAHFEMINEGFTYRDLILLPDEEGRVVRGLLLFQKNERDETPIPCPACRNTENEGNSYPSFGVKSWECANPLCPERSIYNRGKRYSFKGLLTQAAIEDPSNQIDVSAVRRWRRDVVSFDSDDDIVRMLIGFYSMRGDTVALLGLQSPESLPYSGRTIVSEDCEPSTSAVIDDSFWTGPFFSRYVPQQLEHSTRTRGQDEPNVNSWEIVHGDSQAVLASLPDATFDRAVTSPPYFNAREYSQWPNLYSYLNEMWFIHRELYRTLKPGALYYFNIFDYFDNERIITFSLMGKKRIALSALFVDLFRRLGFEAYGLVAWDKGDVEGKRSFNAGNFSPFYQSPQNCWEHVLVFRKPGAPSEEPGVVPQGPESPVVRIHPVVKMVRGKNVLGHTAPYPIDLPKYVLSDLPTNALVLDPFGGSGTTARACLDLQLRPYLIEKDSEYHALSIRLTEEHERLNAEKGSQDPLFPSSVA